ncbi:unnamed protein product [Malus baccata var. baccata]
MLHLGTYSFTSQNMKCFKLRQCPLGNGTIDTPKSTLFLVQGQVWINAPNLSKATIMLEKDWDRYTTSSFQASSCIRKFLANFSCCEKLQTVYVTDPEAPIFPDSMREELSPPLPSLKHLKVLSKCSPKLVKDYGLTDCLLKKSCGGIGREERVRQKKPGKTLNCRLKQDLAEKER